MCEDGEWIQIIQNMVQRRDILNTTIKLLVPHRIRKADEYV
jgi:hypothetical protein